jgi:hypothetical protein
MNCSKCNRPTISDAKFCSYCGELIQHENKEVINYSNQNDSSKQDDLKSSNHSSQLPKRKFNPLDILKLLIGIVIFSGVMYFVMNKMKNDEDNFDVDKAFDEMIIKDHPDNSEDNLIELENQFKLDAEKMGELKCLEKLAADADDFEKHSQIEEKKIELREKIETKYKDFIGVQKYEEMYSTYEEIGKEDCYQ